MTMREKIAYLRTWAETRARQASSMEPESIEEQMVSFLQARAEQQKQQELERYRKAAESKKSESDGDATKKPRRIAVKKTEESANP